jgi:predicted dehydrogenase
MYRCHPQTQKIHSLIKSGAIGKVKVIRASFSYDGTTFGPNSRVWNNELGGGALLDIGGCK